MVIEDEKAFDPSRSYGEFDFSTCSYCRSAVVSIPIYCPNQWDVIWKCTFLGEKASIVVSKTNQDAEFAWDVQ